MSIRPIKVPRKYTRRVRLSSFAERLQAEWNRLALPVENEKIVIAVSGGADSTALLVALVEPVRAFEAGSHLRLVRPLLSWARRADTEDYCRSRRIHFRVDEMNHDLKFTRVKVRKQLLPLMHLFNNKIVEALARTATLLREDVVALSAEAEKLLKAAINEEGNQNSRTKMPALNVETLTKAPAAVRRRALRLWLALGRGDLRRLEMVHLKGVEALLDGMRGGREVHLPNGTKVIRRRGWIELSVKKG